MIPIACPQIGAEEEAAVLAVLRSGVIAQGPQVARFEQAFAARCDVRYAVAVSSGTAALHLALLAHGIGSGDEVITTPFSFIATATSILMTGARPRFVDLDPQTFNLDPKLVEAAITPATKALLPVHLYGHPADMDALGALAAHYGLAMIEDAAQAVGATYKGRPIGSFGTGCFSLYATKNIMTGEGGMITTNDEQIADRLRLLRNHGSRVRYAHELLGYNFRMMDLQAALGFAQLAKLERFTAARRANAAYFTAKIAHPRLSKPQICGDVQHVYHQYTLRVAGDRDATARYLADQGVGTAIFYPVPIHQQQLFRELGYTDHLPKSEQAAREVLALPVHPGLSATDREQIVAALNSLPLLETTPVGA